MSDQLPAFDQHELIPAIIQDVTNGQVLMVAYMNRGAFEKTLETGFTHFYSRSRKKLWKKGEESGHVQVVESVSVDCDGDVLLIKVEQRGPGACHAGYRTCFFRASKDGRTWTVTEPKAFDAEKVYGAKRH